MSTSDYLRQARRLRSVHAHRPAALHAALRELNRKAGESSPAGSDASPTPIRTAQTSQPVKATITPTSSTSTSSPRRPVTDVTHVLVRRVTDRPASPSSTHPKSAPVPKATSPTKKTADTRETVPLGRVLGITSDKADAFASKVEARIEQGLLRYSARQALLADAREMGIGRFDAMLIIASVLHAAEPEKAGTKSPTDERFPWILFLLGLAALIGLLLK